MLILSVKSRKIVSVSCGIETASFVGAFFLNSLHNLKDGYSFGTLSQTSKTEPLKTAFPNLTKLTSNESATCNLCTKLLMFWNYEIFT